MTQPCDRKCPNRSPTCHAECDKYREFAAQQREEYRRRKLDAEVTSAVCEGQIRRKTFTLSL